MTAPELTPPQPRRVLIIGAGDFGREVLEWMGESAGSQAIGFLDDNSRSLENYPDLTGMLIGRISDYVLQPGDQFVMAIANPAVKLRIGRELLRQGATFRTLVHPSAVIASSAKLGIGCVICPQAVVSCHTTLGDFTAVNWCSSVGHDAVLGEGTTLSGHCDVTGHVRLGTGVFLGSHATVLPRVQVGDFARIGAGAVVTRDVSAGTTVVGVPAKPLLPASDSISGPVSIERPAA